MNKKQLIMIIYANPKITNNKDEPYKSTKRFIKKALDELYQYTFLKRKIIN